MNLEEIKAALTELLQKPTLDSVTENYPTLPNDIQDQRQNSYRGATINEVLINALAEACKAKRTEFIKWILARFGANRGTNLESMFKFNSGPRLGDVLRYSDTSAQQWEQLLSSSLVRDSMTSETDLGYRLAAAVRSNEFYLVAILMNAFPSLRLASDDAGHSILSIAVVKGDNDMLDLLLKCGANINGEINENLALSLTYANVPCEGMMLNTAISPFESAIRCNNIHAAQKLIDAGCEAVSPNHARKRFAYDDYGDTFEQNTPLSRALSLSLSLGRAEIAQLLIEHGAEGKRNSSMPSSSSSATADATEDNGKNAAPSQTNHVLASFFQNLDAQPELSEEEDEKDARQVEVDKAFAKAIDPSINAAAPSSPGPGGI